MLLRYVYINDVERAGKGREVEINFKLRRDKYYGNQADTVSRQILAGKPVIKGTRIPVELVLEHLAQDLDIKELFEDYPRLTEEDVKACLLFYKAVLAKEGRKHVRTDQPQRADRRNASVQDALALASAWADLPSDQMEEELDRIRHQSKPTPPIELDL